MAMTNTTDINNNDNSNNGNNSNNQQIIVCPYCKAFITVDELGEHVNANPEAKKQTVE